MADFNPELERQIYLLEHPAPALPEQFGLTTDDGAYQALHEFSVRVHETRALEHPLRTAKILHDFVGNKIPAEAYHAALLHDVVSRWTDSESLQRQNAYTVLQRYFNEVDDATRKYVSSLLGDMSIVEETAESYRLAETVDTRLSAVLRGNSNDIAKQHWLAKSSIVNPEVMDSMLENVNLESVLIKAAELLDNLRNPAPKDRARIQDVFEAESFYAPLCEVLGFDGFSMALRDAAAELRFRSSGNMNILTEAIELREDVIQAGSLNTALDILVGEEYDTHNVIGNLHENAIRVEEIVANIDGQVIYGVSRIKSVGSLAMKLLRFGGETPMDIVGITFIVDEVARAGLLMQSLLRRIGNAEHVEFKPAPSSKQAVHVRGDDEYIGGMLPYVLSGCTNENIHIDRKHKGAFEVSKFTVLAAGIPTEVQIQTENARQNARTGSASHISYKAGVQVSAGEVLGSIHERKTRMKSDILDVNGQTITRGQSMLARLDLV